MQAFITRRGGVTNDTNDTNDTKVTKLAPSDVTVQAASNTTKAYVFVPIELFAAGDGYYTVDLHCLHKGTKAVRSLSIMRLSNAALSFGCQITDALSGNLGVSGNTTRMQFAYERDSSGESFEFVEGTICYHG